MLLQVLLAVEHTRLKSCFDMRCHSGHPRNAPITKYNVLPFFSDLNEMIFKNTIFILNKQNNLLAIEII